MGWGERSRPKDPEPSKLAKLVREYLTEMENPVPDTYYRMSLRQQVGEQIDYPYQGPPRRT